MKKFLVSAVLFATLFMSAIANAEPKKLNNDVINTDSCYVASFYAIDSLVIKNDEKVKIVLVNDQNEVLFVNYQKYLAVSLPAGDYKIYSEKEIKTIYENQN